MSIVGAYVDVAAVERVGLGGGSSRNNLSRVRRWSSWGGPEIGLLNEKGLSLCCA